MSGRTHSNESKQIMSDAKQGITGENHPRFGQNHSNDTKKIMSDAKKGENNPNYGKKVEGSGTPSQAIEVTDIKNNTTISYDSISEAARALNINPTSIVKYFANNQQKPYKGIYTFNKL